MIKESGSTDSLELMVDANGLEGTHVLLFYLILTDDIYVTEIIIIFEADKYDIIFC